MSGNFIYRHHVEPRVKLYSPREESFPIPLKYIDVSRITRTTLDVKQERRIDDYWSIDGSRDLSDSWPGFTQFTLLEEKTSRRTNVVRVEIDEKTVDIQAKLFMAKTLGENWKECQTEGKANNWSNEKFHLDNARKLRGIYFIDPEDKKFKETIKNARKNLETPMAPAMPCKTSKKRKHGETRGKTNEFKSKLACILEVSESTRLRMEEFLPNHHEDHVSGKGDNSLQHTILFINLFLCLKP